MGIKLVLASIYRDVYISLTLTIGAPNDPPSASPVAVSHAYFTLDFFQIFCGTVGDGPHLGAADGDSAAVSIVERISVSEDKLVAPSKLPIFQISAGAEQSVVPLLHGNFLLLEDDGGRGN